MNYLIVNMGTFGNKENKKFYCLDIVLRGRKCALKRVFISEKCYNKLLTLFKDYFDMITFDISKYIVLEPNCDGDLVLSIFEEHILAI